MTALTCEEIGRAVLGEPTKRAGAECLWHCPNHEDRHESLSVNPKKNVFLCAPCNARGTAWQLAAFLARLDPADKPGVKTWLKERSLLNGRQTPKAGKERGQCVAEYAYSDATGNPVARKLRFEPGADGRKKGFAWQRWEDGAWIDGLAGLKTPLYRLPEIQDQPFVILTEGEKDAEAGAQIGLPTTTSGGTDTFRPDHAEILRGKDVVIVADADDPGREHAQRVAVTLYGKAGRLRVCEIPGSKDLAEAIKKGVPKHVLLALFEDTPAWTLADGCEVLDSVFRFARRFVGLTESQARVVALWAAHTHAIDAADCTPYLSVTSAEKQSGKTRLLEVLELLVARPWLTGRVSAAALVRKVDTGCPTLLLDESDAAFRGDKDYAEALRGTLNNGYKRSGRHSLCVGQGANIGFKDFSVFCPKAIAGIGKLPDTVADRSIPVRLKREPRGRVEKLRKRDAEGEAARIKAPLAAWCKANVESLRDARPEIPDSLSDRQADCCEPLLAIADAAGGDWPEAARRALVELCSESQTYDQSPGVRLLADIQDIFAERGVDRIGSVELAEALAEIETSPWAEWYGRALTAPKLARMLAPFGITPGTIRVESKTPKGYYLRDFEDSFARYVPPPNRNTATRPTNIEENADFESATDGSCGGMKNAKSINKDGGCGGVAVSTLPSVTGDGQARSR